MIDFFLEKQILSSIENARISTELKIKQSSFSRPEVELKRAIEEKFSLLNFAYQTRQNNSSYFYIEDIQLTKTYEDSKTHHFGKSIVGGAFVISGLPLLKKRFVMAGASAGTSIASKYLSITFPQVMPMRILGTKVFGRALGRAVPYVGWSLLAIDVIELIIEEINNDDSNSQFSGFGGGQCGGGGAGGIW